MHKTRSTHHAKQRLSERTDINEFNYKYIANTVMKYGLRTRAFSGKLHTYLIEKQISGGHYSLRVYENNIYIFDTRKHNLLTVYPIPEEYLPIENFLKPRHQSCIIYLKNPYDNTCTYVCENDNFTTDIALAIEFRTEQRAINYIKNNQMITILEKQGYKTNILFL